VSGAISAIATFASAAAETAAGTSLSFATAHFVGVAVYSVTSFSLTAGALYGLNAALQPKLPSPQALQTPLKQPMPVRQSAFGRVRVSGAYAYFGTGTVGATTNLSIDMLALLDGRSENIVSFYLNDDLMAPVGDYWYAPGAPGKYGGGGSRTPNLVQIDSRLGLPTETSYSEIEPALPLWDANHRGDGVTSMALYCKPARREDQAGDFPNGVPTPSAVIDAQLIFDARDVDQVQGDKSTYKFSDNPIWELLAYMTDAEGGIGLDYARFIEPAIDLWIAAANECDGLVSTSGMHATLADAAAAGDHKIFLNDTTGLTVGANVQLTSETVTVSALPGLGEVDITGALVYAHGAGELAKWDGTGQQSRYRCAGTYKHDTPPGDVISSILATFDGWMMQRGDGAFVVRTNTIYEPTVVLTDKHIVGYQIDEYQLDEQATNQFIVSVTDPAAAFNKAEAGYVQDDADIASRGQVKSSELYLQWCPSIPQGISVGRAVLARSTQSTRGTITCNLAGLAVSGERYVGVQIGDFPALGNALVEIVGDLNDDPKSMTVSFPFVDVGARASGGPQAICFAADISATIVTGYLAELQAALTNALTLVGATSGGGVVDLAVVVMGLAASSIVKRAASVSDIADIITWVEALTLTVSNHMDASVGMTECKSFFDATDAGVTDRRIIWVWQGVPDTTSDMTLYPAYAAAAQAVRDSMAPVPDVYVINVEFADTTWAAYLDNTPADGIPQATTADAITRRVEQALFGSVSTAGAGYTLPPLAPPSGATLQPLTPPTITSVTPDYADSGGGVSGARLLIEVDDPGGNVTWKLRWKLSADTLWTEDGGPIAADPGPPMTMLSGFVPASGVIDVQVAYVTASQTSDWSATEPVTVAAALGAAASTAKSASFTTTPDHNVYYLDTAGAAITVTLNATPAADEVAEIWDATGHAGANPISFAGNGHNIAGAANVANFIAINFGHARAIFDGTQWLMQ
jgi:hypothetical protein